MSSNALDYEAALGFVISIRPRLAVEDADAAARRLMGIANPDPLATALAAGDLVKVALLSPKVMDAVRGDKKIVAIKELRALTGGHLKECKEAVDAREVAQHFPPRDVGPYGYGGAF